MAKSTTEKKERTPAEEKAHKDRLAEKKIIAALPDSELTAKQLADRKRGRELAAKKAEGRVNTPAASHKESKGDTLENPIEFFHHNILFTDFGYTNNQKQVVSPPNDEKKIEFKNHSRKYVNDPQGKGSIARCSCRYETYSKKEAAYLRNHPYYGKTIFEKVEFIQSADPSVADIMETTAIKMIGLTNNDIINRAQSLKIPVISDLSELRRLVLERMALDELRLRKTKLEGVSVADPKAAERKGAVKDVY